MLHSPESPDATQFSDLAAALRYTQDVLTGTGLTIRPVVADNEWHEGPGCRYCLGLGARPRGALRVAEQLYLWSPLDFDGLLNVEAVLLDILARGVERELGQHLHQRAEPSEAGNGGQ